MIGPKRRPGRPSIGAGDGGGVVELGITFPVREYDAMCRVARRHDISVPELIRRRLRARDELRAAAAGAPRNRGQM